MGIPSIKNHTTQDIERVIEQAIKSLTGFDEVLVTVGGIQFNAPPVGESIGMSMQIVMRQDLSDALVNKSGQ